jgi:trehalose 6-phosphate phosphatase
VLPSPPRAADLHRVSLFLDFDGTLVDLVDRPDSVVADAALHDLLGALAERLDGRLAIVSGRSIAQLEYFLGKLPAALAGSHGIERRARDGATTLPPSPASLSVVTAAAERFAQEHPGVIIETKSYGVALHYRLAPAVEFEAHRFAAHIAGETGLSVQIGKMMVELKPRGDKGEAIAAFLAQSPMAGSTPIFLGDDLTDEPAFAVARAHGGMGILIGPPRETVATHHLPDVAAARAWLRALVEQRT